MRHDYSKNIVLLSNGIDNPEELMDFTAIVDCFHCLKEKNEAWFTETLFVVAWTYDERLVLSETFPEYNHKILLWIADELGGEPSTDIKARFDIIFKNHLRKELPTSNVLSLPLFTPKPNLPENNIPSVQRTVDVLFAGNLNRNRLPLYWELKQLPGWLASLLFRAINLKGGGKLFNMFYLGKSCDMSNQFPNSRIVFTGGFYQGFKPAEYRHLTSAAKIVLNPKGFHSAECFRMYEAMAAGCVVVSEKLPPLNIYHDIPIVQIESWSCVRKVLSNLLSSPKRLTDLSEKASRYYEEHLSPRAIANYIYTNCIPSV